MRSTLKLSWVCTILVVPWSHKDHQRVNQPQSHRRGRGGEGKRLTVERYKQERGIIPEDEGSTLLRPFVPREKQVENFKSFSAETPSQTNKAQVCYHLTLSSSIVCPISMSGSMRCLGCHFWVFSALIITRHLLYSIIFENDLIKITRKIKNIY